MGDKLKATPVMKFKKFISRYPEIFRSKDFDLELLKEIYGQIDRSNDFTLVTYDKDYMRYVLMSLVMRNGVYEDTLVINAYNLLDIYLGKTEEWNSLMDIENKIVCIYLGYSEMENKRQSDIIEQLVEQQRMRGKKCWILYKGNDLRERYPKLQPLIEENQGEVVTIKTASKTRFEEDII